MPDQDPISEFIALPRDQQLSTLQKLSPDKQEKLLGEIKKRKQVAAPTGEARTPGNYASELAGGVGRGISNVVGGAYQAVRHPVDTANAVTDQLFDVAIPAAKKEFEDTKGVPLPERGVAAGVSFLENAPIVGSMVQKELEGYHDTALPSPEEVGATAEAATSFGVAPYALGKMTTKLVDTVKNARANTLRTVTKTGPRVARTLAEDTVAENKSIDKSNQAKQETVDEKNADAKAKRDAAVAENDRITAATKRLNENEPKLKQQLKETEERVHDAANQRYEDLKPKLNSVEADPETAATIVDDSIGQMDKSDSEPPILTKFRKAAENGVMTYGDLDGFRSNLGRELRKGTLPGSTYHIYETMSDAITDEMTRIASEKGLSEEANAARSAWREWAEAFRDRKSPLRQILKDPEDHGFLKRVRFKQNSGLNVIRKFNPELADAVESDVKLMDEIRAPRGQSPLSEPKPVPPAAPPKVAKVTPPKVVTPESLSETKRAAAKAHAEKLYNSSSHLATVFVVLDSVRKLLTGNLGGAAIDVGSRVAYAGGKNAFANYLESPKVLDAVSKITPADVKEIMKLPEEYRQGFDGLLLEAATKTKLKPGVLGAAYGVSKTAAKAAPFAGIQGQKTKHLKALRDSYAYTDRSQQ